MTCKKCKIEISDTPYCPMCGAKQVSGPRKTQKRGNGRGSVYKLDNGWAVSVVKYYYTNDDGRLKPKRVKREGFETKKEAEAQIPLLLGRKSDKSPTLEDYWRTWESDDLPKLSNNKQIAYRAAKKKMEDIFHTEIDKLTIDDLRRIVSDKAKTHYPARDMKTVLSHLYKIAIAQLDVQTNLSTFIRLPTLEEDEPEPFSKDEQNAFWKLYAESDDFAPYILLMIYTGIMPGELMVAKKDSIDWDAQKIVGSGIKTKKRKKTPIVLPDIIIPVLKKICEMSDGDKLIHMNKDNFYKRYYECLERAGSRRLPPYSCRHTTGTALGTSDIPLAITKEIMRHSKISTTEKYIHVDTDAMLEAANKVRNEV